MLTNLTALSKPSKAHGFLLKAIIIYFVVGLVVLFITVQISHKMMTPLEGLAKGFFLAIKNDELDVAYHMCSSSFKRNVSETAFNKYLDDTQFILVVGSEWHSSQENGDRGSVLGTIHLSNGQTIPLRILAVQEKAGYIPGLGDVSSIPILKNMKTWKIYSIHFER